MNTVDVLAGVSCVCDASSMVVTTQLSAADTKADNGR